MSSPPPLPSPRRPPPLPVAVPPPLPRSVRPPPLPAARKVALPPCERCGTFTPLESWWDRRLCADCIGRLDDIERAAPNLADVMRGALAVFGRIVPAALAAAAVARAPSNAQADVVAQFARCAFGAGGH